MGTVELSLLVRPLVLVADDEIAIQELIARVITRLGMVAVLVGDGAAAVAAVAAHRDDLACVILDVVMPIVSGVDAACAIQRIAPELSIILISGAIPAHDVGRIAQLGHAGMLHKPFSLAALQELVLRVVGSTSQV
jgi:two-component system, cell cycle sensor histidine kinase and response regulator CckA